MNTGNLLKVRTGGPKMFAKPAANWHPRNQ
jgi:ribosomal protein S30